MPTVHIPAHLRGLSDGQNVVVVDGSTIADIVDHLDQLFPGMRERMLEVDDVDPDVEGLQPGLSVFIDGAEGRARLGTRVAADAHVYFVNAVGGGCLAP